MKIILQEKNSKDKLYYFVEDVDFKEGKDVKLFGKTYKLTKKTVTEGQDEVPVYIEYAAK